MSSMNHVGVWQGGTSMSNLYVAEQPSLQDIFYMTTLQCCKTLLVSAEKRVCQYW